MNIAHKYMDVAAEGKVDFEALIQRCAADPADVDWSKRSDTTDANAAFRSLLLAIDETVLPREIVLHKDQQEIATLCVANRRLNSFTPNSAKGDASDPTTLEDLALCLCNASTEMTGLSRRRPSTPMVMDKSTVSHSAHSLHAALATEENAHDVATLTHLLTSQAVSILTWGSDFEARQLSKSEKWHDFLETHAQQFRAYIEATSNRSAHNETTGVALPLSRRQILILAASDEGGLACVVQDALGLRAIGIWQDGVISEAVRRRHA